MTNPTAKVDQAAPRGAGRGFFAVAKTSVLGFLDHECLNLAAGIVYYTLQSLIPLILGFIAVASLILSDESNKKSFVDAVTGALPAEVNKTVNFSDLLDGLAKGAGSIGLVSILLLLWTGSGIFAQFMVAINKSFGIPKDKRSFLVKLGLRLAMLPALGLLIVAALAISAGLAYVIGSGFELGGVKISNFAFLLGLVGLVMPLLIETGAFAILYRLSPNRKGLRWRPILIGAAVAAVLLEILKVAFGFYITSFGAASNAAKTYGALGGIIVFLLFVYLVAAVILFGAEVAAALHHFPATEPVQVPQTTPAATAVATSAADVPAVTPQVAPVPAPAPALPPAKKSPVELVVGGLVMSSLILSSLLFQRKDSQ